MSVIDNIIGMLKSCGILKKAIPLMSACVSSAGELVSSTVGLVGASAGVVDQCTGGRPAKEVLDRLTPLGKCMARIGDSVKGLVAFATTVQGMAKKECSGKGCVGHVLALIDVLSETGEALSGAFDRCDVSHDFLGEHEGTGFPANQNAACAESIFGVVNSVAGVAHYGYQVGKECKAPKSHRLYSEHAAHVSRSSPTLALVVALPIAAVMSFFGGLRFGKFRRRVYSQV
jgi:hypothetical protein